VVDAEEYSPQMKQNRAVRRAAANKRTRQNRQSKLSRARAAPLDYSKVKGSSAPRITNRGGSDQRIRVVHEEMVRPVYGSTAYSTVSIPINPGLASSFPWLSQISRSFESYQFNDLKFDFNPQISEVSTQAAGTIACTVDYDAADAAPLSLTEQLKMRSKKYGLPSKPYVMNCDKADLMKFGTQRYIRSGALAGDLDIKTYDVGNLVIGTVGQPASTVLGLVSVKYDVTLMTPQEQPLPPSALVVGSGSVSKTAPYGTAATITGSYPVVQASGTVLTFNQAGQFLVEQELTGTTLTSAGALTSTGTISAGSSLINTAATNSMATWLLTITEVGQTVTLDAATGNTTVTATRTKIADYQVSLGN